MSVLSMQNVQVSFGGPAILDDLNLKIQPKERIGLLGRNGAGKSTLMKLIAGEIPADSGDINKSSSLTGCATSSRRAYREHRHDLRSHCLRAG